MESEVYFTSVRARSDKENKISKVQKLFDAAGMGEVAGNGDLAAVKVHFGERGADAYINPVLVRQVVDKLKSSGSMPFVTDTNTLYGGGRSNSADHVVTAILHGFDYSVVGAPVIIADGLKSQNFSEVGIDGGTFSQ